jgi:DNA-binding NarL/FixJ family response regulator
VDLLLTGAENKDIAKELGISCRTVKANFIRMYMKYGITDGAKRVKLAVMAYRESASSGGHSYKS